MRYDISELRSLVTTLLEDLDKQVERKDEVRSGLEAVRQEAVDKSRTADELDAWLEDCLTQVAIAWVQQWHNELDPEFGIRFGDYLETFVAQHAAELGVGFDAVENARL